MKQIFFYGAIFVAISATSIAAGNSKTKRAMNGVSLPELPARAVQLLNAAPGAERESVAIDALEAAIAKSPASAPAVVGALSKAAPDLAAVITSSALALESAQSSQITSAAVAGAPAKKGEILTAANGNGNGNGNGNRGRGGMEDRSDRGHGKDPGAPSGNRGNGRRDDNHNPGPPVPGAGPHHGRPPHPHGGPPGLNDYSRPRHDR